MRYLKKVRFDWAIKPGSRIAGLPFVLKPLAVFLRETKRLAMMNRVPSQYHHRKDGIYTKHLASFINEPRFKKSYERGIEAGGFDYQIPYRVHQAIWASNIAQRVEGDYVELGTGRGFIMSCVLADYDNWSSSQRKLWLFDTFSSYKLDASGAQTSDLGKNRYYSDSANDTKNNFNEWNNVNVIEGNVYETLLQSGIEKIALLHLDLNNGVTEAWALRELYPKLVDNAVILFDDYDFNGCEDQHDQLYTVGKELGLSILSTPTGQGIAVK